LVPYSAPLNQTHGFCQGNIALPTSLAFIFGQSHHVGMILPAFLAQFAAGCLLIVSIADIRRSNWKYLRLMACVSLALAANAVIALVTAGESVSTWTQPKTCLIAGVLLSVVWLFVNAAHHETVRPSQRIWPALAGLACLVAALLLTFQRDATSSSAESAAAVFLVKSSIATILGAGLLGGVTAAMLLGHRYLTDTDMPIAPLRWLAIVYLFVLSARTLWTAFASIPLWTGTHQMPRDPTWFWLIICVRLGVGLVMTAIFAAMAWDCVRRRATQSATALFYLSMVFVFIGELAAQYLWRSYAMPL
jgi:hypothetical protein